MGVEPVAIFLTISLCFQLYRFSCSMDTTTIMRDSITLRKLLISQLYNIKGNDIENSSAVAKSAF